jgi:hypothetical protein
MSQIYISATFPILDQLSTKWNSNSEQLKITDNCYPALGFECRRLQRLDFETRCLLYVHTYTFQTDISIKSDITLSGSSTDVLILQTLGLGSGSVVQASNTRVTLDNVLVSSVFW